MESWLPLIIQLLSGAAGGIGAGKALKDQSLGTLGNAISGLVGGGLGGVVLNLLNLSAGTGTIDPASIGTDVAGGGIGGAVVLIIVGIIKKALGK
ncbi:MAG: hypothetical protein GYA16_00545 [Spirochaetes bacterium]|nr:hypothetical protein [Spirochaetota bacterium]